jgi:hypothetical protein
MMLWETLVLVSLCDLQSKVLVLLQVVQFIVLVAGVKNVIAKQLGSNNLLNNARQFVL